jgi:hypothetical protein
MAACNEIAGLHCCQCSSPAADYYCTVVLDLEISLVRYIENPDENHMLRLAA